MGLLDINDVPPPTVAQMQHKLAQTAKADFVAAFAQMKNLYSFIFGSIWQNGELTPQQAFDAFGTNAVELKKIGDGIRGLLNSVVPGTITAVEPNAVKLNDDGTITVGDAL